MKARLQAVLEDREDDPAVLMNACTTLGRVALESRDYDRAAGLFNQALELA